MARATQLLHFHEEVEKDLANYEKHGRDWSDVPVDLTLQGTEGYSYNTNRAPDESTKGKYYPSGHRPAGYGSGNGETKSRTNTP